MPVTASTGGGQCRWRLPKIDRLHVREEDGGCRHPPLEVELELQDEEDVQDQHHEHAHTRADDQNQRLHLPFAPQALVRVVDARLVVGVALAAKGVATPWRKSLARDAAAAPRHQKVERALALRRLGVRELVVLDVERFENVKVERREGEVARQIIAREVEVRQPAEPAVALDRGGQVLSPRSPQRRVGDVELREVRSSQSRDRLSAPARRLSARSSATTHTSWSASVPVVPLLSRRRPRAGRRSGGGEYQGGGDGGALPGVWVEERDIQRAAAKAALSFAHSSVHGAPVSQLAFSFHPSR